MKSIRTSIFLIISFFLFTSIYAFPCRLDFSKTQNFIHIKNYSLQSTIIKDSTDEKLIGIIISVENSDVKNTIPAFSWTENGIERESIIFKFLVNLVQTVQKRNA